MVEDRLMDAQKAQDDVVGLPASHSTANGTRRSASSASRNHAGRATHCSYNGTKTTAQKTAASHSDGR